MCGICSGRFWCAPVVELDRRGEGTGANVAVGTIIATFIDGVYPNNASGNHAAVYVSQDAHGLTVWDQWTGQPVHKRVIHFRGGQGSMSNDGDAFWVVEGANPLDAKPV